MKKVGILTLYYKTYNYGAQLQSYALQKVVEKLGYESEQISFRWSKVETEYNYQNFSIDVKAFREFSASIPHSRRIYTPIDIEESVVEYDAFICGSDQIWGVNDSMPSFVLPLITLDFVPHNKNKIAYAASLGGARISKYKEEALSRAIKHLDAISVREVDAIPYISEIASKKVQVVLDPVFLLSKEEWDSIAISPFQEDYILIYCIGQSDKVKEISESIAAKYGYRIITLTYNNGMKFGPREFIGLIEKAKFVITDSFHATVFSVIFHKQFFTLGVDNFKSDYSKNIRILNLLKELNLSDRFADKSFNTGLENVEKEIDYIAVEKRLSALRQISLKYLENALRMKHEDEKLLASQKTCSGCGACVAICPQQCITFKADELGFMYPYINKEQCLNCGLCTSTCPTLNTQDEVNQFKVRALAVKSKDDEIRMKSSSGGAFYAIASNFIKNGGTVVACRYGDDFSVEHAMCSSIEQLDSYCRSKYVQSQKNHILIQVKKKLVEDCKVLFVGTPCEVQGLKRYLGKNYNNLYTIDLVCGGVTSPELWRKYIEYQKQFGEIDSISMRDKTRGFLTINGFPNFSMRIKYKNGNEKNIPRNEDYFLNTRFAFYRENCYSCAFKGIIHQSDLTLGDFCGINYISYGLEDGKGWSLVIVQSEKGNELLRDCSKITDTKEYPVDIAIAHNPMVMKSMEKPVDYYYMHNIFPTSTIEKLFYERKDIMQFSAYQELFRKNWIDQIRNDLFIKVMKYIEYGLELKDDPSIQENIIIYGAGKIGKLLAECTKSKDVIFLDRAEELHSINGYKVFRVEDKALKDQIIDQEKTTVIVTPIWDYESIKEKISEIFPNIGIISLEEVMDKI